MSFVIAKPPEGAACNQCGMCCRTEICGIGKMFFGADQAAPCPALMFVSGRYWCQFVLAEDIARAAPLIGNALGIGKGCCATDESREGVGQ